MIRVLVVEDEPPIMRAVKSLIEQTNPAFTVAATAADGALAVELLEKEPFDVVFTDIRMPVMDGLALLEYIHARHPDVCAVVLSGYSEFEYAQQALKSRAYEYLLKPVSPEPLARLLERLETILTDRDKVRRKRQISRLINKSPDETALDGQSSGKFYAVMLICAGPFLYDDGDALSPGAAFWNETDACTVLASGLTGRADFWMFRGETAADRILVVELPDGQPPQDAVSRIFIGISGVCCLPVTVVAYAEPVETRSAGNAYKTLRKELLPAVRIGRSSVNWIGGSGPLADGMVESTDAGPDGFLAVEEIVLAVRDGNPVRIEENLNTILLYLESLGSTQARIAGFLQGVLERCLQDKAISPQAATEKRREVLEAVSGSMSFAMLHGNVSAVLSSMAEEAGHRTGAAVPRKHPAAGKIEAYLQRNYRESITNLTLSQEFGFVPSYISRIFREHTGLSVSDYLVKIRVDRAKRLLQENPGIMVKEVADRVGFKDQYHFSKTFKRLTGMWPTEYRH